MKKLASFLLILSAFGAASPPSASYAAEAGNSRAAIQPGSQKLVRSLADFKIHTRSHIARVELLGMEVYRLYPQRFRHIAPGILRSFLRLHDQSKVNETAVFRQHHGYSESKKIADRLYEFYGKNMKTLTEEQRARSTALVGELNGIDNRVAMDFFRKNRLLTPGGKPDAAARELLRIEHLSDLVDRGMSSVSPEEFGKVMAPASRFMPDAQDRQMAEVLEMRYKQVVRNATYERLRSHAAALFNNCVHLKLIRLAH